MSTGSQIDFLFESNASGSYVAVLADSALVPGSIVSQNAGSSLGGIYYQVGGSGMNKRFLEALGDAVGTVNAELVNAYDRKIGAGNWKRDSANPPSPPLLTSLLVSVSPSEHVGSRVVGMVYSVGPMLTQAGLTPSMRAVYTQIYRDAMSEIAASPNKIEGFRITVLSGDIYRGGAPIGPFFDAAAGCIIDAVRAGVKADPVVLGGLTILINTNADARSGTVRGGFTNAATAMGAQVTNSGFSISV